MKIVYIKRDYQRSWKKDSKKAIGGMIKKAFFYFGVEGFFEASLHQGLQVKELSASRAIKKAAWINKNFDAVVVHHACQLGFKGQTTSDRLIEAAGFFSLPKVLFFCDDQADVIPEERVFDAFDLVFKREIWKDKSRYAISAQNRNKLFTTMLGSPLKPEANCKIIQPLIDRMIPKINEAQKQDIEVFFSGTVAQFNNFRADIWRRVKQEGFKTAGGLQYRGRGERPEDDLLAPEMNLKEYLETISRSKICLALNGVGEFTFRHLELWQAGAFMLCPAIINEIDLPLPIEDGKHFVSFSTADDLIEKIKYYLVHEEERKKIARSGREMFEKEYGSVQHGENIKMIVLRRLKL